MPEAWRIIATLVIAGAAWLLMAFGFTLALGGERRLVGWLALLLGCLAWISTSLFWWDL